MKSRRRGDGRRVAGFDDDDHGRVLALRKRRDGGAHARPGHSIDFGVATTSAERAAILAQRFRVYQRRGYHRPGITVDPDEDDTKAIYFLATLTGGVAHDARISSPRETQ
ncbi:MAG: hypothetical protein HY615_16785 [Candidatus Rokubacteria bacterium]|nr:hypothetical protein [Candidatus Rokubacteria bacterium]